MAANDTRRLKVIVTGESQQATQALEQVGEAAEQSQGKLGALAKTVAGFAGKGALAFGALGAAAATMGIQTASKMEQATIGFTTMLGSGEKAQAFLKQLQTFANTTPFEFDELTGAAQRLMAMGFAAKDVIPMLTAVGDAVAAMGGSAESVDAVTTALGQMQAKGKVSGEELMQLTEQGIPALRILADSYGVSTSAMSKMISDGAVLSDRAIPALIRGLEQGTKNVKGFGGMMNAQSASMSGKWSTLMDTMKSGLGNIAANFLPAAKTGIDLLSNSFSNFFKGLQGGRATVTGFQGVLNQIGMGFHAMIGAFKEGDVTSKGIVGTFELVGATLHGVINAFKEGKTSSGGWRQELEGLAVATKTFLNALGLVAEGVKNAVVWLHNNEGAAKALLITITALTAITKAHAIATGVDAAGGLLAMFKNMALVNTVTKVAAALQWAWNGAVAAASYLQIAGYLSALVIQQKAMAVWSKVVTAAQWLWNAALTANPIGIVVVAIAALVGAIVLLWKNNEGFRNWVLGTLWPSLKKAWDQISGAFKIAINAIVKAFQWTRDMIMSVWNAIWAFMAPIVTKIVAIISPIVSAIMKIQSVLWSFYTNAWKIVWILIQVAVKIFVAAFQSYVGVLRTALGIIGNAIKWLYNTFWKPQWMAMKAVANAVIGWVTGTLVPSFKRAWDQLKGFLSGLRSFFVDRFNDIQNKVRSAFNAISGPIAAVLSAGISKIRGWLSSFRSWWNGLFDGVSGKSRSAMDKVVAAFNKGRDGIKRAWDSVVNITKKPINFVVNDVYNNRIRPLWNTVAEKFGISTRLDTIKGFAKGGTVPGSGNRDSELAMLTPGEGILTKKEMKRLGGSKGFNELRAAIAQYNKGGVVGGDGIGATIKGWGSALVNKGKDIFQGVAGSVIKPLVNSLRSFINSNLSGGGFTGLLRGGGNTILDKLMSWVTKKDKEMPAMGSGGSSGMGWARQRAIIAQRFPGLHMISGFRPGAITLTGHRSYHSMGRAVDYPANHALAQWLYQTFGKTSKELITPWQSLNINNGRPHRYTGAVWNQHNFAGGNAHVHWAMDDASVVQPGWFTGYNGTGKPEKLVNADKYGGNVFHVNITVNGSGDPKRVAKEIRDELINLSRRNGGQAGLPKR